jgi:hypothetical protein
VYFKILSENDAAPLEGHITVSKHEMAPNNDFPAPFRIICSRMQYRRFSIFQLTLALKTETAVSQSTETNTFYLLFNI